MYKKQCTKCKRTKIWKGFYINKRKSGWDKFYPECKVCTQERNKKSRDKYKDLNNKKSRIWRKKNKDKLRNTFLMKKYGITLAQYNDMLKKQNYSCFACEKHYTEFTDSLSVDHDHKTGKVRGLLCWNCNRALGCLFDNVKTLSNLISLLKGKTNV